MDSKFYKGVTHLGFADEHNHNAAIGRYGSLALVTLPLKMRKSLEREIVQILNKSRISDEFKWEKTKDARYKHAAITMIEFAVNQALQGVIRIDILVWDYHDERHSIQARDNIQNFHRMYHHLLNSTLHKFWPNKSEWVILPDETSSVNWENVQTFINGKSLRRRNTDLFDFAQWLKSFHVRMIEEVSSVNSPISQLADLFAGMSAYSRNNYQTIKTVSSRQEGGMLFPVEDDVKISRSDQARYEIINCLLKLKRKYTLGISFDNFKGFKTPKPDKRYPVNFWWYKPQHDLDKAPTKFKKKFHG